MTDFRPQVQATTWGWRGVDHDTNFCGRKGWRGHSPGFAHQPGVADPDTQLFVGSWHSAHVAERWRSATSAAKAGRQDGWRRRTDGECSFSSRGLLKPWDWKALTLKFYCISDGHVRVFFFERFLQLSTKRPGKCPTSWVPFTQIQRTPTCAKSCDCVLSWNDLSTGFSIYLAWREALEIAIHRRTKQWHGLQYNHAVTTNNGFHAHQRSKASSAAKRQNNFGRWNLAWIGLNWHLFFTVPGMCSQDHKTPTSKAMSKQVRWYLSSVLLQAHQIGILKRPCSHLCEASFFFLYYICRKNLQSTGKVWRRFRRMNRLQRNPVAHSNLTNCI